MSDGASATGSLVVGLLVGYFLGGTPSPVSKFHVAELYCSNDLDLNDHCVSVASVGSELSVSINARSNVVQIHVDKNDGQYGEANFYRNNCKILDARNWLCSDQDAHNNADVPVETVGMDRGVYYRTNTSNVPPDFYASSISWYPYLLYKYKLVNLTDAIWLSNSL
jgi:hypothetical protein